MIEKFGEASVKSFEEEWEDHFEPSRREQRRERKHAQRSDRSKFKETDQRKDSLSTVSSNEGHLVGRVAQLASHEIVVDYEGERFVCSLKGSLKLSKNRQKNLVVVGDTVFFDVITPGVGAICSIAPRTSFLSREDHLHRRNQQLVVANVEKLFIVTSLLEPALRTTVIDRYLIAARKGNLFPILVINKWDRLQENPSEADAAKHVISLYRKLDVPVLCVSATTGEGLDELRRAMTNTTSVLSGQSGTGKTLLVNRLTGLSLKTSEIRAIGKGAHTTTSSQLIKLPFGGYVADTPGFRSLGIFNLTKEDLADEFSEIFSSPCTFTNCWHIGEKGCAVLQAIENGLISPVRYNSYLSLLESIEGDSPLFPSHRIKKDPS